MRNYTKNLLLIALMISISITVVSAAKDKKAKDEQKKKFGIEDVMKFKSMRYTIISDDGNWLGFTEEPDFGDGIGVLQSTKDSTKYNIPRGYMPAITTNSEWAAFLIKPKTTETENSSKDKPKDGMALVKLKDGAVTNFKNIKKFVFSDDSKWLAYQSAEEKSNAKADKDKEKKITGNDLILRQLSNGAELTFQDVTEFSFDSTGNFLAFVVAEADAEKNGLFFLELKAAFAAPQPIMAYKNSVISNLSWNHLPSLLAFVAGKYNGKNEPDSCTAFIWNSTNKTIDTVVALNKIPSGWYIPFKNNLKWTFDHERLFLGLKPIGEKFNKKDEIKLNDSNLYNADTILQKADYDLWHWNDPRIKTHQKVWWKQNKDKTYLSVYFTDTKRFVQLADSNVTDVEITHNNKYAIGYDDKPYLKEQTYNGFFTDLYVVNLRDGAATKVQERLEENAYVSPLGKYIAYFKNKHWYLYDILNNSVSNLTKDIAVNFYNEDNDLPKEPESYGFAGWVQDDQSFVVYDKYDIWQIHTQGGGSLNRSIADGRMNDMTFRLVNLDKDKQYFGHNEKVLAYAYSNKYKWNRLYHGEFEVLGYQPIFEDNYKYRVLAKAKKANKIIYTKESFQEFPDVWTIDTNFVYWKKITDVNPQLKDYRWGYTQLMNWKSADGDTLDGFLIKPDNYDSTKKYPVIVYFYEKFSDMLYNFHRPRHSHSPCFAWYLSDDYIWFLPDIKYKDGSPGNSAMNCIMPALRKLIDDGVADSSAIGIWGHSWSGYQTTYMITRTNLFAAAVAGAAVGNMTSAYSGIRLESGLARQFQYEKYQSRIGGNLWDSLYRYIDNSPIFGAPKANTPLLIMFGDVDQMVPWQQGIEIYLAWRRLNKNCLFLQYHGEGHWPTKYPNRLDYSIKMKQFYDTYLKKQKPADWIINGLDYKGE